MSDTDLQDVFLGRQPILDRQQQLFAYELLFRSGNADRDLAALPGRDRITLGVEQPCQLAAGRVGQGLGRPQP